MLLDDIAARRRFRVPRSLVPRSLWISGAVVLVLIGAALTFLLLNWPFTRDAVARGLGRAFASTVEIQNFRSIYFPHPGCVAETVQLHGRRAEARVSRLTVEGSWANLLVGRKRIERITADGVYALIVPRREVGNAPPPSPGGSSKTSKLLVREIVANDAVLEVQRSGAAKPLHFDIHRLKLENVGAGRAMSYHVELRNPEPPGDIASSGEFGPWRSDDHAGTPLHGSYTFSHADLGQFRYVAGLLSSKGTFSGALRRIEVQGPIEVSGFEVKQSGHRVDLRAHFHAFVNGTNGDVTLDPVEAHFARTTILSRGGILGTPGRKGKTISLDMRVRQGHIQDLMHLLMKTKPPMDGVIGFNAKVRVPPDGQSFLRRVLLTGDFGIGGANFTSPRTQTNLDILSERARGNKNDDADPENVISNLKGHVDLRGGVAKFSNLSFSLPGAEARLDGTYNLLDERVDLGGTLAMQAEISQATRGFKSFLLKAFDPLFKRKTVGAVVPVRITGTYSNPSYGFSLLAKKHR